MSCPHLYVYVLAQGNVCHEVLYAVQQYAKCIAYNGKVLILRLDIGMS